MNVELGETAEKYLAEEARRACLELSDAGVARLLAGTEAIRRDLRAHEQWERAEVLRVETVALGDVVAERRQLAEAAEDALSPTVDLGELPDDEGEGE